MFYFKNIHLHVKRIGFNSTIGSVYNMKLDPKDYTKEQLIGILHQRDEELESVRSQLFTQRPRDEKTTDPQMINMFFKTLTEYGGNEGVHALETFLDRFKKFFSRIQADEITKLDLAENKLKDNALLWWRNKQQNFIVGIEEPIDTFEKFDAAIRKEFIPVTHVTNIISQLQSIHQGNNTVDEYISEFNALLSQIPRPELPFQLGYFLSGLNESISDRVTAYEPNLTSLDALQNACRQAVAYKKHVHAAISETPTQQKTQTKSSGPRRCKFCRKLNPAHPDHECFYKPGGKFSKQKQAQFSDAMESTLEPDDVLTSRMTISVPSNKPDESSYTHDYTQISFCLDSGSSEHMVNSKNYLYNVVTVDIEIQTAGQQNIKATHKGSLQVKTKIPNHFLVLQNVLFVPDLRCNLFSVACANDDGIDVFFNSDTVSLKSSTGELLEGHRIGKTFTLTMKLFQPSAECLAANTKTNYETWHRRLGHSGKTKMSLISNLLRGIPDNITVPLNHHCEACETANITRKPFPPHEQTASENSNIVVSDICGPFIQSSLHGSKYFLTFIDAYTRYTKIFPIQNRTQEVILNCLRAYVPWYERQSSSQIKIFRSDNAKEFVGEYVSNFLRCLGIIHQKTVPFTPAHNSIAERMNRTMLNKLRVTLHDTKLPIQLWDELLLAHVHILNNMPVRTNNNTIPSVAFFKSKQKPNVAHFKILGCRGVMRRLQPQNKLDDRGDVVFLVSYNSTSKAYNVWNTKTNKIQTGIDIIFDETVMYGTSPEFQGDSIAPISLAPEWEQNFNNNEMTTNILQHEHSGDYAYLSITEKFFPITKLFDHNEKSEYLNAMNLELQSLLHHKTWCEVPRPHDKTVLPTRWVLCKKFTNDGQLLKHKARFIVRGNNCSIPQQEITSPTIHKTSLRIFLSIITNKNLLVHSMDVKTAFLQSPISSEIYIELPEIIYTNEKRLSTVGRLQRSLYGLKQSPKLWSNFLNQHLQSIGFLHCEKDPCLLFTDATVPRSYIAVYVDDLLLATHDQHSMQKLKNLITSKFECVDNGPLHDILGLRIFSHPESMFIDQSGYSNKILSGESMQNCTGKECPIQVNIKDNEKQKLNTTDLKNYQRIVGELLYLAVCSRPDLIFATSYLSRFLSNATTFNASQVKYLLRFLKQTTMYGLQYNKETNNKITAYVDAAWANADMDCQSTAGYFVFYGTHLVSWRSYRLRVAATSSSEAELHSLATCIKETIWIAETYFQLLSSKSKPQIEILTDSTSASAMVLNGIQTKRTRYISINLLFVKEQIEKYNITIRHVPSADNLADLVTKPLRPNLFRKFRDSLVQTRHINEGGECCDINMNKS